MDDGIHPFLLIYVGGAAMAVTVVAVLCLAF
jgi:hypothetical protein